MKWIKSSERLPDDGNRVLVYKHFIDAEFDMINGGYDDDKNFKTDSVICEDICFSGEWRWGGIVTHWMRLPEPPKD